MYHDTTYYIESDRNQVMSGQSIPEPVSVWDALPAFESSLEEHLARVRYAEAVEADELPPLDAIPAVEYSDFDRHVDEALALVREP